MAWERLAHVALSSAGDTIDSGTFTAKENLVVMLYVIPSGTANVRFRFNSDTGSNYADRKQSNGGTDGAVTSQTSIRIGTGVSANQYQNNVIYISNKANNEKILLAESIKTATGAGTTPDRQETGGKWVNTSDSITSIQAINTDSGDFAVGSYITVFGATSTTTVDEKTLITNLPEGTRFEAIDTKKMYRWATPTKPQSSKSYTFGTSQIPAGNNVTCNIGDSGTKMYLASNSSSDSQKGYQYTLSTAYDVSTASYASKSYQFGSQSADTRGMKWKNNGTYCYKISDQTGNKAFYRYTASTAWDISTLGSSQSYTYSGTQSGGKDLELSSDGTKIYGLADNATIYQYTLSTAWQVSSGVSYASKSFSCSSQDNAPRNFQITNSGTKLRYLGSQNNKLYTYTLSTAWDISTASYDGADSDIDCSTFTGNPYGVWCKDDFSWIAIAETDSPYDVQQFDKDPVWKVRGK